MAAHKHWSVILTPQSSWVSVKDIELRTSIGGANAATGGVASASTSDYLSGAAVSAMFDGNASTVWGAPLQWVRVAYEFASAVEIVEVSITDHKYVDSRLKSLVLSYSDDGQVWSVMAPSFALPDTSDTHVLSGFIEPTGVTLAAIGLTLDTQWPTGPEGQISTPALTVDVTDGGPLAISGTVAIDDSPDIPVRRRVRLFEKLTGRLVREAWSGLDGGYSFTHLKNQEYFVLSHDHTNNYNAAIKDRITPE